MNFSTNETKKDAPEGAPPINLFSDFDFDTRFELNGQTVIIDSYSLKHFADKIIEEHSGVEILAEPVKRKKISLKSKK